MLAKQDLANAPAGAQLFQPARELATIGGRPMTDPSREFVKLDSGQWIMVAYDGKPRSYKRPASHNTFKVGSWKDLKGFTLVK